MSAGCAAGAGLDGSSASPRLTTQAPQSATPSPEATYAVPAAPADGEVASAVADRTANPPSASSVAGPGLLVADRAFTVEGQCVGTSADFRLATADPADAGRVLLEGTLDCAAPVADDFTYTVDYAGVVQLTFTDTDGIELGWLRVVQP